MPAIPRPVTIPATPRDAAINARPCIEVVDDSARREAKRIADIGRAVAAVNGHDRLLTARGLLHVAAVLCGDDPLMRTTLALAAVRLALRLDSDVADVRWH
jgi:hypothetical protein